MDTVPRPAQLPLFPEGKTCSTCKQAKPLADFYVKDKRTGRRLSSCKVCHNTRTLERYNTRTGRAGNEDRRLLAMPPQTEKQCARCGEVKLRDAFGIRRGRLRSWCNACRQVEKAAYVAANKSSVDASNTRYRRDNREMLRARYHQWCKDHPDRASAIAKRSRTKHQERVVTYNRAWRKANLVLCNTYWSKRRARLKANGGSHTVAEWEAILERYGHRCLACGRTDVKLTVDHIVAINNGGTDFASNLQPLCHPCNAAKGDRTIDYRP